MKTEEKETTVGRTIARLLSTTVDVGILLVAAYVVFRPGGLPSQYLTGLSA